MTKKQLSLSGVLVLLVTNAVFAMQLSRMRDSLERSEKRNAELSSDLARARRENSKTRLSGSTVSQFPRIPVLGLPSHSSANSSAVPGSENSSSPSPAATPGSRPEDEYRISARVSAIEKFVNITDAQREGLKRKFTEDILAERDEGSKQNESTLEDILGKENADYYRQEMKRAFETAENEDREKDTLFLSRKLGLSAEQEDQVRNIIRIVSEKQKAVGVGTDDSKRSMQDRLRIMLEETKMRQELLDEQLRPIFTPEQYQLYLEQQRQSSEGSFEVFHESH